MLLWNRQYYALELFLVNLEIIAVAYIRKTLERILRDLSLIVTYNSNSIGRFSRSFLWGLLLLIQVANQFRT